MDPLTFVAELAKALSWPVAAVAIALIFREQIRALLQRIKKGKVGPAEFEFEERVAELRRETAEAQPPSTPVEVSPSLVSQALNDPRGAIVSAWLQVEEAARDLALSRGLIPPKMAKSAVSLIRAIQKAEIVNLQHLGLFDALRDLRNRAVHDADFSPDSESVLSYAKLSAELVAALKAAK